MRAAGIDPAAWLAHPRFDSRLAEVIQRLLRAADALYRRADAGLAQLPARCRPGMYAARMLYAEIGREVARRGYDSVNHRAVVPWQHKSRLLAAAVLAAQRGQAPGGGEALQECAFLLDAVQDLPESGCGFAHPASIGERVAWLTQLFERLERRDHPV
jgi:phytoene synthase